MFLVPLYKYGWVVGAILVCGLLYFCTIINKLGRMKYRTNFISNEHHDVLLKESYIKTIFQITHSGTPSY